MPLLLLTSSCRLFIPLLLFRLCSSRLGSIRVCRVRFRFLYTSLIYPAFVVLRFPCRRGLWLTSFLHSLPAEHHRFYRSRLYDSIGFTVRNQSWKTIRVLTVQSNCSFASSDRKGGTCHVLPFEAANLRSHVPSDVYPTACVGSHLYSWDRQGNR